MGPGHLPSSRHGTWAPTTSPILSPASPCLLLTPDGHHWRSVQTCSLEDLPTPTNPRPPPPPHTPSGGHRNTHGWQAGDMHPTGMLSCHFISWLPQTNKARPGCQKCEQCSVCQWDNSYIHTLHLHLDKQLLPSGHGIQNSPNRIELERATKQWIVKGLSLVLLCLSSVQLTNWKGQIFEWKFKKVVSNFRCHTQCVSISK